MQSCVYMGYNSYYRFIRKSYYLKIFLVFNITQVKAKKVIIVTIKLIVCTTGKTPIENIFICEKIAE